MNPKPEISAAAASDAYTNRSQGDIDNQNNLVDLDGGKYTVFGYKDDQITGFHATAYRSRDTGEIIIAYRGTDPAIKDITGHTLTSIQDIAVDATMVRDAVNPQKSAADKFTAEMIDKAARHGISKDQITVAGHSLGGTLAEIEAAKFGLRGSTYNAYGAAGLTDGPPAPGCQLTDYVMAGDVVSAANHHVGSVVTLASPDDLKSMQAGRYLDAPAGAQPPNPFLAMSLGDHSVTHFAPPPHSNQTSVLDPKLITQYEKNYTDNKAAIDAYRNDVYRERGELSEALRQAQGHDARAQLPPDIRKQLDEYLTVNVDPLIQKKVEQNGVVLGAEHGLQTGTNVAHAGGQYVQSQFEHMATTAHKAGDAMAPVNPIAPLAGAIAGEAAHLQGQVAHAVGDLAANSLHTAQQAIERGTHGAARTIDAAIHSPEVQAGVIHLVNGAVGTYRAVENAGHAAEQTYDHAKQAVSHGIDVAKHTATTAYDDTRQAVTHGVQAAEHTAAKAYDHTRQAVSQGIVTAEHAASQAYNNTKQAVSHGADVAEHAVGHAYDKLTHPGQWFGHDAAPATVSQPQHPPSRPATGSPYTHDDPRHAASPNHALYRELHERIPDASEQRLLQFTAACHTGGITHANIGPIAYDEQRGIMHFMTTTEPRPPVAVDVKTPSPDPQHSIHQIQQANQLPSYIHAQAPAQGMPLGQ
ncbi:hypothetical protein [Rhodanobacter sp. DHG33]|uniref:hypothetical protein n=1 Tax=Rhodanobacter sp. DHG33 TaxID=2775921 RepID=UPI00177C80BB|nr:hypothetical protein [Rhodanobacter sp. DHG33]MBD8899988.1 hypothetical protein [Rhodanobacter sp. DHG33]